MEQQINVFIDRLAKLETTSDAYNQFAYGNEFNDIRRANLSRYFQQMWERQPEVMLVMEAPGYRGSRLTGVPVTSRRILLEGVPELNLFGKVNGFQDVPEPGFEAIRGEQSATAVWGTLTALNKIALIWNTYPFHPRKSAAELLTNRAPRRPEVELGKPFIRDLLDLFGCKTVIAVGNVGDESLRQMGIEHFKVRHPAQGGKNEFVSGMTKLLSG
jgi:uracil-DNA glycosylase